MIDDPGPIPDCLLRPEPTARDWDRFFAARNRKIVMPTRNYGDNAMTSQSDTAAPSWKKSRSTPPGPAPVAPAAQHGDFRNSSLPPEEQQALRLEAVQQALEKKGVASPTGRTVRENLAVNGIKPPKVKPRLTATTISRGAVTDAGKKAADPRAGVAVEALLAEAKKKGYKELPYPNGGVRVMRIKNFLRNLEKKASR